MKILITAGGTKIRLDDVRYLDWDFAGCVPVLNNFSTGAFGAKLADAFTGLWDEERCDGDGEQVFDHQVHLLRSTDAIPARREGAVYSNFSCSTFFTYEEYSQKLEELCRKEKFDIVIVAAAVSDYGLPFTEGKISSDQDEITIKLRRLPKVITKIKEWNPGCIQIGFKLLSNVTEETLLNTAIESGKKSGSDFTIANDLGRKNAGDHFVYLIDSDWECVAVRQSVNTQTQVDRFANQIMEAINLQFDSHLVKRSKP